MNLMLHTAQHSGFFDAITVQMTDNSADELEEIAFPKQQLIRNLSKVESSFNNLAENFTGSVLDQGVKKALCA